ncbi:hypothetical protein EsH8_X_000054 [Colletotrichum jinshuiense]
MHRSNPFNMAQWSSFNAGGIANQTGMPLQVYTPRQSVGHVLGSWDLKFENGQGQVFFRPGLHSIAYFVDKAKLLSGVGWVIEQGKLKNLSIMFLLLDINFGKHIITIGERFCICL